jgi:mannose-6-phosphate isomerase-like protein (cupin superfamily)
MATGRRIITGVDAAGKSVVLSDEALPERTAGVASVAIYSSSGSATVPVKEVLGEYVSTNRPEANATSWQIIEFVPSGNRQAMPRRLHSTDTFDYFSVRSGELTMFLDDGAEVVLKAGDHIVMGGVEHGWANRTDEPCVAECIVIGIPRDQA